MYRINKIEQFRNYQNMCYQEGLDKTHLGYLLDMGLGKTVVTLSVLDSLMYDYADIDSVLIIAPKRVAESVWEDEIKKWEHLKHMKISKVLGSEKERLEALSIKADVYIMNPENTVWLFKEVYPEGKNMPFDTLVIDELSKFKSRDSKRFKTMRKVRGRFKRILGLTGTPASNGYLDLWAQMYILDGGQRLFKNFTQYRDWYFLPDGYGGYKWKLRPGSEQLIQDKIADLCVTLKSKDLVDIPDTIINNVPVELPPEILSMYKQFEKDQVFALKRLIDDNPNLITAVHSAALVTKLLQFSNGAIYDENRDWHVIHDAKLKAIEEIYEDNGGKPMLVAYNFVHDKERLIKYFGGKVKIRELRGGVDINDWNAGKIDMLVAHPASAGHGLNLQFGGHIIVWFSPTFNLEHYEQFIARLARPGQQHKVILNQLYCIGTEDMRVYDAVNNKKNVQAALMEALQQRIRMYNEIFSKK